MAREKKVNSRINTKKMESLKFSSFIYKVLKEIHPQFSISKRCMTIMNNFMQDMFEKIASEAGKLVRYNKKKTLSGWDIEAAVKLVYPGDLSYHAMQKAILSSRKYNLSLQYK